MGLVVETGLSSVRHSDLIRSPVLCRPQQPDLQLRSGSCCGRSDSRPRGRKGGPERKLRPPRQQMLSG